MTYKAKLSFSGVISMAQDEEAEIADPNVVKDLLRAGYIEEVKPATKVNAKANTRKKGATKNE